MRLIGLIGASGSGKTTLIAQIIPLLRQSGFRVSTIKHAHHGFDLDRPGKDSFIHRTAGAEEVMVASGGRWALLREQRDEEDVSLHDLVQRMTPVDLLIVEGFKQMALPKIEVHRPSLGKPPFFPADPHVAAVASDEAVEIGGRTLLSLSQPNAIADFIVAHAGALS